jgi:hypothetical protein
MCVANGRKTWVVVEAEGVCWGRSASGLPASLADPPRAGFALARSRIPKRIRPIKTPRRIDDGLDMLTATFALRNVPRLYRRITILNVGKKDCF